MSETRICTNCGAEHPIEAMYQVEGDWLCEACADRLTVVCDHCDERIYEENAITDDDYVLCDDCFDAHYVRCDDCGRIIYVFNVPSASFVVYVVKSTHIHNAMGT